MRKCMSLILVAGLLVVFAGTASARVRIERWLDISGDYSNLDTGIDSMLTLDGNLNFILGVRQKVSTRLKLTAGEEIRTDEYGVTRKSVPSAQELNLNLDYTYKASRYTSFSLTINPIAFRGVAISVSAFADSLFARSSLSMNKYISKRFNWSTGLENWMFGDTAVQTKNRIYAEIMYFQPFGRYQSKVNLTQKLNFTKDIAGSDDELISTTVVSYELYKRLTLDFNGAFALQRKNGWSVNKLWKNIFTGLTWHWY